MSDPQPPGETPDHDCFGGLAMLELRRLQADVTAHATGINETAQTIASLIAGHTALVSLLCEKGLITQAEYHTHQLRKVAELDQVVAKYLAFLPPGTVPGN